MQSGFARKSNARHLFVCVYRKGRPGEERNTLNVGVEKHFYDEVDDEITEEVEPECVSPLNDLGALPLW